MSPTGFLVFQMGFSFISFGEIISYREFLKERIRKGVERQLKRWKQEGDVDYGKLYPISSDSDSSSSASNGEASGSDSDTETEHRKQLVIDENPAPHDDIAKKPPETEKTDEEKNKVQHCSLTVKFIVKIENSKFFGLRLMQKSRSFWHQTRKWKDFEIKKFDIF